MRIGICEDNETQVKLLKKMIGIWEQKHKHQIDVISYHSAEAFLFAYEKEDFDILLLDIQMGDMSGMDLAKKLRETNNDVVIIFITALKDFVLEGYEVDALHYLIKPVEKEKLYETLQKAYSMIENQKFIKEN